MVIFVLRLIIVQENFLKNNDYLVNFLGQSEQDIPEFNMVNE